MKKLIALILAALMLTGCAGVSTDVPEVEEPETATAEKVETDKEEKEEEKEEKKAPKGVELEGESEFDGAGADVFEMHEVVNGIVDLEGYKTNGVEGSSGYDAFLYTSTNQLELDYKITLDGDEIEFPYDSEDLVDLGWKYYGSNSDQKLKSKYVSSAAYTKGDGRITVGVLNDTDDEIEFKDAKIYSVNFTLYDSLDNYEKSSSSAVDFEINGAVDNDSTMADVVDELGEPTSIHAFEAKYDSYILFKYKSDSDGGWIEIRFSDDGEKIVSFNYNSDHTKLLKK